MNREETLLQNFQAVQNALSAACKKTGRNPQDITLLAVTKYAQDQDVLFFLQKGLIRHIGESRVQQAWTRWTSENFVKYPVVKHFIGQLFDFIDSLDNFDTALALEQHLSASKTIRALVQVKLTQKETQSGLPLEEARALAKRLKTLSRVKVCGYMGIAPQGAPEAELRTLFGGVKRAFDQDFPPNTERYLSLGMSEDFITAVEEGSSLPRIGSRLFAANLEVL